MRINNINFYLCFSCRGFTTLRENLNEIAQFSTAYGHMNLLSNMKYLSTRVECVIFWQVMSIWFSCSKFTQICGHNLLIIPYRKRFEDILSCFVTEKTDFLHFGYGIMRMILFEQSKIEILTNVFFTLYPLCCIFRSLFDRWNAKIR